MTQVTNAKLLSTEEAADRLGVSCAYLNKRRLTGGGPRYAKIGVRVLYDPADLSAWVEDRKRASTSEEPREGASQ